MDQSSVQSGALLDAFRHSGWATKQLLASCRNLSVEQLTVPTTGTFGGIEATFNHLVLAHARYLLGLTGSAPAWALDQDESADLDELEARVEETQGLWEWFLSEPLDAERVLVLDEGTFESRAGVSVTQALHHGSVHREQICAILTGLGVQPPDLEAWAYALATGRARFRRA